MKTLRPALVIFFTAALTVAPAFAQTPSASPGASPAAPPPSACVSAEFRQFDLWLGRWEVTNPQGKVAGTSEITRVSEGCALREHWTSAGGKGGMSINYYDPADKKWHQDWVGGDGTILHLQGGLNGTAMVLSGESKSPQGTILNRITWTPLPAGKVRQEWTTSSDAGATWQPSFNELYTKQP